MSQLLRRWTATSLLEVAVWVVALLLALGLPVTQMTLADRFHRGTLSAEVHARGVMISQRIAMNPQLWMFEGHRLEEFVNKPLHDEGVGDHRLVADAMGQVLAQSRPSAPLQWPIVRERQNLHDNGRIVGWVEVRRSLRPDLNRAVLSGMVTLTVNLLLAFGLVRLPLRRLRLREEELEYKAYHDDLTGLHNRDAFRRLLSHAVAQSSREHGRLAVLYIDLDRFKTINDTLGHDAGDNALCAVAQRLRECAAPGDVVARLSGDEFAILTELPQGQPLQLPERLLEAFRPAITLGDKPWHLGCSIGVAQCPEHGREADRLLACADTAMLHAKASGRSAHRMYHDAMEESILRRVQIEDDLRGALERGEFVLHYQPLVELATGRVKGCEALLRWQHPARGLVPPIEFIGVLEEMGLIHAVGRWVLLEASRQWQRWQAAGVRLDMVAVNVSPLQFARQSDFVDQVREVLADTGLPARHLQLEMTEGTLLVDNASSLATLNSLRQLGLTLAIDDFGTGYSSLSYLRHFPVSVLKIDRSFVRDMHAAPQNLNLIKAIVQMAHSLGLCVTAEGIETHAQRSELLDIGCDTGQGYGLGRPVPAEAFQARALEAAVPA